jgi:hypothetical protein
VHQEISPNGHARPYVNGHAPQAAELVRETEAPAFRRPPHNLEAEQALLGAILVNNEAMDKVSSFLEAHHFFDPLHQQIFETAAKLMHAGKVVTPITLRTFFESAPPVGNLTVTQYLGTLASKAVTIINAADYGRTIFDLATRRALIIIGEDMVTGAYDAAVDAPPASLVRTTVQRLEGLCRADPSGLCPVTLDSLMSMDLPRREFVLRNLLQERSAAMVYAWRGAGKTWFALGLGHAIASGTPFLKWEVDRPRHVLHVCGELPLVELRDRLDVVGNDLALCEGRYRVLSDALHDHGLPDLASPEGQAGLERVLGDAEVIVLDNISTLFRSGVENEAESWAPVQQWLLRLRRQGRTVILIHHAGKGRTQRGTAKREDILDIVLHLRAPSDYEPSQGARFEVHFEKHRGLYGADVDPFEARLETRDGASVWAMRDIEDAQLGEIEELKAEGWTVRRISQQLGMSKSAVQRALDKSKKGPA